MTIPITFILWSNIENSRLSTIQVRDDQGDWKNDPELVAQVSVDYYTGLLGKATPTRVKVS